MMIRCEKGVTDGQADRQTERSVLRAAWLQLKQGKSGGLDGCDWPSNLTRIGFKSPIFQPV